MNDKTAVVSDEALRSSQQVLSFLEGQVLECAQRAKEKLGGPLNQELIRLFLQDSDCVRYSTKLVFTREGLEPHQFGDVYFFESDGGRCCELRIDPIHQEDTEGLPFLIAYLTSVINYGSLVLPEMCLHYGAELMGLDAEAFYGRICEIVDGK